MRRVATGNSAAVCGEMSVSGCGEVVGALRVFAGANISVAAIPFRFVSGVIVLFIDRVLILTYGK